MLLSVLASADRRIAAATNDAVPARDRRSLVGLVGRLPVQPENMQVGLQMHPKKVRKRYR
jgi:hypothetical protein